MTNQRMPDTRRALPAFQPAIQSEGMRTDFEICTRLLREDRVPKHALGTIHTLPPPRHYGLFNRAVYCQKKALYASPNTLGPEQRLQTKKLPVTRFLEKEN